MKIKGNVIRIGERTSLQSLAESLPRDDNDEGIVFVDGPLLSEESNSAATWRTIRERGLRCVAARELVHRVYRDGINSGVAVVELSTMPPVESGAEVELDLHQGRLRWTESGSAKTVTFSPLGQYLIDIVDSGGLIELAKRSFQ